MHRFTLMNMGGTGQMLNCRLIIEIYGCTCSGESGMKGLRRQDWGWSCWFAGMCRGSVRTRISHVLLGNDLREECSYGVMPVVEDVVWCACHNVTFA